MEIHTDQPAHYADFVRLNERWVREYFEIEPEDERAFGDPSWIVAEGGHIYTGVVDATVVAAVAMIRKGEELELSKMAVDPAAQGAGYGRRIGEYALAEADRAGVRRVYLLSNTVLAPAIALYRKLGFETVQLGPHPEYARCNIVMERSRPG